MLKDFSSVLLWSAWKREKKESKKELAFWQNIVLHQANSQKHVQLWLNITIILIHLVPYMQIAPLTKFL